MFGLANPDRFMRFTRPVTPVLWGLALVLLAVGTWLSFTAPADYQQGDTVRIMFIHVPAATLGLGRQQLLIDDEAKAGRAAAVLGLVGLINLPIVKFSVDWWNTLHQPASLLRAGGTSLDPAYLAPLLTMMAAYGMLFGAVWLTSIRTEVRRRRVLTLRARAAQEA